MKRSIANIVVGLFDMMGVLLIYFYVYQPTNDIFRSIATQTPTIEYNTRMYLLLGFAVLWIIHIIGLIETYRPRYFNRSICTKVIYGSLAAVAVLGIFMTKSIKHNILQNGYSYCEGVSKHMKISHFAVYVRNNDTCRKLTSEKEKRRLSDLR